MKIKNKLVASLLSIFAVSTIAATQVEFTVMHGPGGVSDITTRELNKGLNYNVMNRPGAGGRIAVRHLMQNDAVSLATMAQVYVTNPIAHKDLEYNPYKDLELIGVVGVMPSALVCNKQTGINSFKDFVNNKKPLSFAVGGYGSSEHLSTEVLISKSGVKHKIVAYAQGGKSSVIDLMGGHIDCMFANYPTIKPNLQNENLNFIMVSHNVGESVPEWSSEFPGQFPLQSYLGLVVSSKLNSETKAKIKGDLEKLFQDPQLSGQLSKLGLFPKLRTDPAGLKEALDNNEYLKKFILENNIKITN